MLYRYLKANQFGVAETIQMWTKDLEWMESTDYSTLLNDHLYTLIAAIPQPPLSPAEKKHGDLDELNGIAAMYPSGYYGRDLSGRPVYYDRVGQLNARELLKKFSLDQLNRYWILSHEISKSPVWQRTYFEARTYFHAHLNRSTTNFTQLLCG